MGNMTISVDAHPSGRTSIEVSVPTLNTGINIFNPHNATEGVARHYRWPYYRIVSSSSFDFIAVFRSYAEREAYSAWMKQYMDLLATDVGTDYLAPMTFSMPARNFLKEGIPQALQYGDDVLKITYPVSMSVKGGSDPVEIGDLLISYYYQHYPTGNQDLDELKPRYPSTLRAFDKVSSEQGEVFETSDTLSSDELADLLDPPPRTVGGGLLIE